MSGLARIYGLDGALFVGGISFVFRCLYWHALRWWLRECFSRFALIGAQFAFTSWKRSRMPFADDVRLWGGYEVDSFP